jgi:hypothetical protein
MSSPVSNENQNVSLENNKDTPSTTNVCYTEFEIEEWVKIDVSVIKTKYPETFELLQKNAREWQEEQTVLIPSLVIVSFPSQFFYARILQSFKASSPEEEDEGLEDACLGLYVSKHLKYESLQLYEKMGEAYSTFYVCSSFKNEKDENSEQIIKLLRFIGERV